MIEITNVQDERQLFDYIAERNKPRDTITHGVFPNCVRALKQYEDLLARLSDPNDLGDKSAYHQESTAPVQPYIEQLQIHMQAIVDIVITVDLAAIQLTGGPAFGVQIPNEIEEE